MHVVKSCILLVLEAFASDEHVQEYSQAQKKDLLEYAMIHWLEHARTQGEDQAAFQSMIPLLTTFLGYSTEGGTFLQRYLAQLMDEYDMIETESRPLFTPLVIICSHGLYTTLGDWWECIEIDHWQGNSRIESPLTLAAMSNSVLLCSKLIQRGEILNT